MSNRVYPGIVARLRRAGGCLLLTAFVCLAMHQVGSAAHAQGISQSQLNQLSSDDYEVREQAMQNLLRDERLTSRDVVNTFPRARSAEQRHRLLSVAWHHLMREQLAAMVPANQAVEARGGAIGIKLSAVPARQLANNREAAILVVGTSPGFPGYAYLRPHDLILSVNGETLPQLQNQREVEERFVARIKQLGAGTKVEMEINRNGKLVREVFELSDHTELQRLYGPYSANEMSQRQAETWMRLNQAMLDHLPVQQPLTFSLPEARKTRHVVDGVEAELAGMASTQRRERLLEQMAQLQRDHKSGRITAEQYAQQLNLLRLALEREEARAGNVDVRGRTFVRPGQPIELQMEAIRRIQLENQRQQE